MPIKKYIINDDGNIVALINIPRLGVEVGYIGGKIDSEKKSIS